VVKGKKIKEMETFAVALCLLEFMEDEKQHCFSESGL